MSRLKILHAADLHLDTPFEGLNAGKAALRRGEQRDMLIRLAALADREKPDIVLLAGDIFDSDNYYVETGKELTGCLEGIGVPVFISPGNHDFYSAASPWAKLSFSRNVHVFHDNSIKYCDLPALNTRVYGAAFTGSSCEGLMQGRSAPRLEGIYNILCIHGEVGVEESAYNPISMHDIENSDMDYIALGHIHRESGLLCAGGTHYAWPGCTEGRGWDETGEKYVYIVELDGDSISLRKESIAMRRYEVLKVDVSGCDPLLAVHTALPDETVKDIYRIILTGTVDEVPDMNRLKRNLNELFFELQLRDGTQLCRDIWAEAGNDTLRGVFLQKLKKVYDAADNDNDRHIAEQAARWGLAALEGREEVVSHEDI